MASVKIKMAGPGPARRAAHLRNAQMEQMLRTNGKKQASACASGFLPESVKNIADASGFVKIRQKACNLTKKRQISMNISPRMYILHEEA